MVYEWTGTLEVARVEMLHCETSEGGANNFRSLSQHDTSSQHLQLQIYGENIDETPIGFDIRMGDTLNVTGSLRASVSNTREYFTRNSQQQKQAVSRETLRGANSFSVETEHLIMMVMRTNSTLSEEPLEELARQFETGVPNPEELEEFQRQMEAMLQPKDEDTYDVEVTSLLAGVWNLTIQGTEFSQETKRGETKVGTNESYTLDMAQGFPQGLILTGQYSKGEDGKATITATVNTTTTTHFSSAFDCPDIITTVNGTLHLKRNKSKN